MKTTRSLIQLTLILICINMYASGSLIAEYLKKDTAVEEIVRHLKESQSLWNTNALTLEDVKTERKNEVVQGTDELAVFSNFKCESIAFLPEELNGEIRANSQEFNSSISLVATTGDVVQMRFSFNYTYETTTGQVKVPVNGTGVVSIFSNFFNYTQTYEDIEFELKQKINNNLFIFDTVLNENDNARIKDILKQEIGVKEILDTLHEKLETVITTGMKDEYTLFQDLRGEVNLELNSKTNIKVNYEIATNPVIKDTESAIFYYDGSVSDSGDLEVEDSTIPRFTNFNTTGVLAKSPFQIFLHKKVFVNLFKLDCEKKLYTIYNSDLAGLHIPMFNDLSINWLSKFLPDIKNTYSSADKLFIEYHVDKVSWVDNNAKVDFTFYIISSETIETIVKYKMSYYFMLEVEKSFKVDTDGVNFYLRKPESFKLINIEIVSTPQSKFDHRNFKKFAHSLLVGVYNARPYTLFKEAETFNTFFRSFNTVEVRDEGIIVGLVPTVSEADVPEHIQSLRAMRKFLEFLN